MSHPHKRFARLIEIARALKNTHQTGKSFHVSAIFRGSKIIVLGTNSYIKSNPVCAAYKRTKYNLGRNHSQQYGSGIHSEQAVLGKIKYRDTYSDLTLVNVRIDNNNQVNDSCVCLNCASAIAKTNKKFKAIYFSTSEGFLEFPQS